MILRDYQTRAVEEVIRNLHSRPVLVAPTGSGKTVMGVEVVRRVGRTLWVAHRRELIAQAAQRLAATGLDVGIIMAGATPNPRAQVQVASIQTLQNRVIPNVELVVIDEAHHARADSYALVTTHAADQKIPILGLTATPFRLDGKGLGDVFGRIITAATTRQLCEEGTLIAPTVYAHPGPDMTGVRKVHGDYSASGSATLMDKPKLIGDIVETWEKYARGKRTVIFAVTVKHSRDIVDAFRESGHLAEHLDGDVPVLQRDAILQRLRSGATQIVSNCMVLTEGWDLPALECAIIARPTASLCLHLQIVGRIMRSADGKTSAIVLDHAGNHNRLGSVTQEIEYSLNDEVTARTKKTLRDSVKTCPGCYLMVPVVTHICPNCGHSFTSSKREIEHQDGELVRYEDAKRPPLSEQQVMWDELERHRIEAGYREGWTTHRFQEAMGFVPTVVDGKIVEPARADQGERRRVFEFFKQQARQRGYKVGWASHQYKRIFGVWPRFARDREDRIGRVAGMLFSDAPAITTRYGNGR